MLARLWKPCGCAQCESVQLFCFVLFCGGGDDDVLAVLLLSFPGMILRRVNIIIINLRSTWTVAMF